MLKIRLSSIEKIVNDYIIQNKDIKNNGITIQSSGTYKAEIGFKKYVDYFKKVAAIQIYYLILQASKSEYENAINTVIENELKNIKEITVKNSFESVLKASWENHIQKYKGQKDKQVLFIKDKDTKDGWIIKFSRFNWKGKEVFLDKIAIGIIIESFDQALEVKLVSINLKHK